MLLILLLLPFSTTANYTNSALPDTLIIHMETVKGFGEISPSSGMTTAMDERNPWFAAQPEVSGIPGQLDEYTLFIDNFDFVQHAHQSYKAGLMDSTFIANAFKSWNADPDDFSDEYLDIYVAILVWEEEGTSYVKFAHQLPLDFSAAETQILPASGGLLGADNLVITEITHQLYMDGEIITKTDWYRVSKGPDLSEQGIRGPIFFTGSYSHRRGDVTLGNETYTVLLHNMFSGARFNKMNAGLYIPKEDVEPETIKIDQVAVFGDIRYRFADVNLDGSQITLVRIDNPEILEGTQIGFKAIDFSHETITGEILTLSDLEGQFVLLDFWGSWCAPCVYQMPYLVEVYRLFSGEGFEIVGVAFDNPGTLYPFMEEWGMTWPQILQQPGTEVKIIELYNIEGYPTTFLLDKERIIRNTHLGGFSIEQKLAEEIGLNSTIKERLKEGSYVLQIQSEEAKTVHVSGKGLPFRGRIPLYNIDGSWTRGLNLEPGTYSLSFFINGKRGEVDFPGKTTNEFGNVVYILEIGE